MEGPQLLVFAALLLIAFAGFGIIVIQRGHESRLSRLERAADSLGVRVETLEAHVSRPPADLGLASRVAELERETAPTSAVGLRRAHVRLDAQERAIRELGRELGAPRAVLSDGAIVGWSDERARTVTLPRPDPRPTGAASDRPPPLPEPSPPSE